MMTNDIYMPNHLNLSLCECHTLDILFDTMFPFFNDTFMSKAREKGFLQYYLFKYYLNCYIVPKYTRLYMFYFPMHALAMQNVLLKLIELNLKVFINN